MSTKKLNLKKRCSELVETGNKFFKNIKDRGCITENNLKYFSYEFKKTSNLVKLYLLTIVRKGVPDSLFDSACLPPPFKFFVFSPLFSVTPPFRFTQFSPPSDNPLLNLIRPTNFLGLNKYQRMILPVKLLLSIKNQFLTF